MQQFFFFCSGVSKGYIKKCPSEINKYCGIGATIFFTAVFAFLASAYALFTISENILLSIGFGLLWGAMIFNLDRYIVSSMKKSKSRQTEWAMAIPRLILAIILAIVISRPLELKIFEPEIASELVLMQQELKKNQEASISARFTNTLASYDSAVLDWEQKIASAQSRKDMLAEEARKEADGTGGSMQKNLGPIYLLKKADADKAEEEFKSFEADAKMNIAQLLVAKDSVYQKLQSELLTLEGDRYDGMATRLEALGRLGEKNSVMATASWFILLLFICIETAPIFVKLISPRGPVDEVQMSHEHVFVIDRIQKVSQMNHQTNEKLSKWHKNYMPDEIALNPDIT